MKMSLGAFMAQLRKEKGLTQKNSVKFLAERGAPYPNVVRVGC